MTLIAFADDTRLAQSETKKSGSAKSKATQAEAKKKTNRESPPTSTGSPDLIGGSKEALPAVQTTKPKLPKLDDGTPREIWQRYFKEQKPKPAEVSETVRWLHQERKHEHTIACVETALIHSQPQPWMYEVLALSMELAGRPKADIERVMLSGVDFTAASLPDMLGSAAYLKRLGFGQRALSLYQQAVRVAPKQPEPYILGLRIARDLNDAAGVEWGATGVLTNVWRSDFEIHHKEAENIAAVAEESLRKAGKAAEADTLKAAVAAARQRDLMLKLTWSGTADLDLNVEEPNGGVCSFDNPFTIAGGVHTHDGYGPHGENCFEEYICAKGLPGDYLIRVNPISGDVVGRRAELTIRRYVGTPDETTKTMSIEISDKDKVIKLSLNEGRRETLMDKPTITLPVQGQPHRDANDPVHVTISRQVVGPAIGGGAVARGGAIGFQPVIRQIPDGIGLSGMAIVSGDRRYVKMSLAPLFQTVIGVDSFSIPSGR